MAEHAQFDPSKYLVSLKGKDYLEVKWRLVWLRERHPDASIATELIAHDEQNHWAMFRAWISIPNGGAASGHGSESARDFGDYLEKAETKAIGRALGALGFGTQFSAHEFSGEHDVQRPVDSPVSSRGTTARQNGNHAPQLPPRGRSTSTNTVPGGTSGGQQDATPRQVEFIKTIAARKGLTVQEVEQIAYESYAAESLARITKRDASLLIDALNDMADAQPVAP